MSLAAEFWTLCSFSRRCLGQPERSELQQSSLGRTMSAILSASVIFMTWHTQLLKFPKSECGRQSGGRHCTHDSEYKCGETADHAAFSSSIGWTSRLRLSDAQKQPTNCLGNGCTHNLLTQHWMNLRILAEKHLKNNRQTVRAMVAHMTFSPSTGWTSRILQKKSSILKAIHTQGQK